VNRRPITIWIVQVLFVLLGLIGLVGTAIGVWQPLANVEELGLSAATAQLFLQFVRTIVLFLPLFFGFRGLQLRKPYGRWLSLGILVLCWGCLLYQHPKVFDLGQDNCLEGQMPCLKYSNEDQMAGGRIERVLSHVFLLTLIVRLAFTKSIQIFFEEKEGKLDTLGG
jgi:hypothetical protein